MAFGINTSSTLELIVVASVALLPAGSPAQSQESACPPNLQAWRIYGNAEAGGEWGAQVLEIHGDVGILRDVLIRFGDRGLSPEEVRWFDAPEMLEPDAVRTRTVGASGDELSSFCRHLSETDIARLRERSRPRCFVNDSGARMLVTALLTVTDTTPDSTDVPAESGFGVTVGGESIDEDELDCEHLDELVAPEVDSADIGPGGYDSVQAMMEEMAAVDGLAETGLAAVPPARYVLDVVRERDDGRVPRDLPSEFQLNVAAAPQAYAEALAVEGCSRRRTGRAKRLH